MSNAANLSPKNPLMLVALAAGAWWFMSRRPTSAAYYRPVGPAQPATVGSTVASALTAIGNIFSGPSTSPRSLTDDERRAIRAGDPYYGGTGEGAGVNGTSLDLWYAQVLSDARAYDAAGYDDSATGDPYNQGY